MVTQSLYAKGAGRASSTETAEHSKKNACCTLVTKVVTFLYSN